MTWNLADTAEIAPGVTYSRYKRDGYVLAVTVLDGCIVRAEVTRKSEKDGLDFPPKALLRGFDEGQEIYAVISGITPQIFDYEALAYADALKELAVYIDSAKSFVTDNLVKNK